MRHHRLGSSVVMCCLILTAFPSAAGGQTSGFPTISARQYTGGSAKVTVSGSATIDQDIPLNAQASFSDGEVSWLQFGVSGAETPSSLITYGETKEIGISVGKGKFIATAGIMPGEKSQCSGKVQVTETEISGDYTCAGVVSHDPAAGMGKVDIKVRFTAKS
ncbi:MAG TPA: hypothetical protein VMN37_09045 [Gemmatimonadales bacterium]|nr:hypothetical protein [Gemmatimonadales bacterium]